MKVWNNLDDLPRDTPFVASIGNYDGVHLGHRTILAGVREESDRRGCRALLITFDPHPLAVVAPDRHPTLLQTRRQKLDALERAGLDHVLILAFDADLAELDGSAFFDHLLGGGLRLAAVHVGENFRFGNRRGGDLELLRRLGGAHGFDVRGVPPVSHGDVVISSTAIRTAVAAGEVDRAALMLGRPFALTGEVVRGEGRGRALEFPTANLAVENETVPANGVYVSETVARSTRHASMTNVGTRPTFGGADRTVETHILDFDGDLYGERIEVRMLARVRDEQRFDGPQELSDQIARDRAAVESYFNNMSLRG